MNDARKHRLKVLLIQICALIIFFVIWEELDQQRIINSYLFPTPIKIASEYLGVMRRKAVYTGIGYALEIALFTYFVTLVVGLASGLAIGSSSFVKQVVEPYLVLIHSTPKAIFLPVLFLLLGIGYSFQFWFGFFGAVVTMTLNMMFSVATVPTPLITNARAMGASRLSINLRVIIPSVTPTLLASSRLIFGPVFGGVLLAEQFIGTKGIGFLLVNYSAQFAIVPLYVIVSFTAIVGIAAYLILLRVERYFTKWITLAR